MNTYSVEMPDGRIAKFTSKRSYTHIVAVKQDNGSYTIYSRCSDLKGINKAVSEIEKLVKREYVIIPL